MAKIIEITDKNPITNRQVKIDKNIVVQIKSYLSVEDYAEAVNTIVESCFVEERFIPEFKEIAKRYMILTIFTDIDFEDMSLEEIFKISQNQWYDKIENTVAQLPIYYAILEAADIAIDYKIRTRKTSFDNLCDSLGDFAMNMSDTTPFEKIAKKLESLSDKEVAKAIIERDSDE